MTDKEMVVGIIAVTVVCLIFAIPIILADRRKLPKNIKHIIGILSVCGIFLGITWVIALLMSIFCEKEAKKRAAMGGGGH